MNAPTNVTAIHQVFDDLIEKLQEAVRGISEAFVQKQSVSVLNVVMEQVGVYKYNISHQNSFRKKQQLDSRFRFYETVFTRLSSPPRAGATYSGLCVYQNAACLSFI